MSLEDKLAIQEVIARFSYAWDAKAAEDFAQLFSEDAVLEIFTSGDTSPQLHLVSRTAIRQWAVQNHAERLGGIQTRHHQSGLLFDELTSETARTRTMVLVTHQEATEAVPRLHRSGMYQMQWRKLPEGWCIAHLQRFLF
jgi:uncharacterized protein (TIGR02246 family)